MKSDCTFGERLVRVGIPTRGGMDLPLSELCEDVNLPGQPSEIYGRWEVGTYAHLHSPHTLGVLVAIATRWRYSQG